MVLRVQEQVLEDGAQAASAGPLLPRRLCNRTLCFGQRDLPLGRCFGERDWDAILHGSGSRGEAQAVS